MHRKQMTTTTTATRPTEEKRWVAARSVCASIKYRERKKEKQAKLGVGLGARREKAKKEEHRDWKIKTTMTSKKPSKTPIDQPGPTTRQHRTDLLAHFDPPAPAPPRPPRPLRPRKLPPPPDAPRPSPLTGGAPPRGLLTGLSPRSFFVSTVILICPTSPPTSIHTPPSPPWCWFSEAIMARFAESTDWNSMNAHALARTISSSLMAPKRVVRVFCRAVCEMGSRTP